MESPSSSQHLLTIAANALAESSSDAPQQLLPLKPDAVAALLEALIVDAPASAWHARERDELLQSIRSR